MESEYLNADAQLHFNFYCLFKIKLLGKSAAAYNNLIILFNYDYTPNTFQTSYSKAGSVTRVLQP